MHRTSCDNPTTKNAKKPSPAKPKLLKSTTLRFDEARVTKLHSEGIYTKVVIQTKVDGDDEAITYVSNDTKVATVTNTGVVTFLKTGKVTITATTPKQRQMQRSTGSTATYTLTITRFKPADKATLISEINRADDTWTLQSTSTT